MNIQTVIYIIAFVLVSGIYAVESCKTYKEYQKKLDDITDVFYKSVNNSIIKMTEYVDFIDQTLSKVIDIQSENVRHIEENRAEIARLSMELTSMKEEKDVKAMEGKGYCD